MVDPAFGCRVAQEWGAVICQGREPEGEGPCHHGQKEKGFSLGSPMSSWEHKE